MASFPDTEVTADVTWSNFHATIAEQKVKELIRPVPPGGASSTAYGTALSAILKDSFERDIPIRTMGATWSLSNIVAPGDRILDPSDLNGVRLLDDRFASGSFAARVKAKTSKAALLEGGAHIFRANQVLGEKGYAVRTSGAADGHRIAGLIATATHGSALHVGGLHETVKALHLVIAPDKAILLQPNKSDPNAAGDDPPFEKELAEVLEERTGIPTELVTDDALFFAAQVSLGSMGFVYSVVMDVAPLYVFDGSISGYPLDDPRITKVIETLDGRVLDPSFPASPYHLALVVCPYAADGEGVFATVLKASPAAGKPYLAAPPKTAMVPSNTADLLADVIGEIDSSWTKTLIEAVINGQARKNYGPRDIDALFPGQVFGPTRLPPGTGTSTELCFDHADANAALAVIKETLRREADQGRHLLAALGVRFVPQTRATLGMNIHEMNCFIELPTVHASYTEQLFTDVWDALDAAGIQHAFHWGQVHRITPARVEAYYGSRASKWKSARQTLLDPKAQKVFASPILKDAGLG
jgi:hypothetical protein